MSEAWNLIWRKAGGEKSIIEDGNFREIMTLRITLTLRVFILYFSWRWYDATSPKEIGQTSHEIHRQATMNISLPIRFAGSGITMESARYGHNSITYDMVEFKPTFFWPLNRMKEVREIDMWYIIQSTIESWSSCFSQHLKHLHTPTFKIYSPGKFTYLRQDLFVICFTFSVGNIFLKTSKLHSDKMNLFHT